MSGLRHLVLLVRLLIEDRQRLALENVALRHQLAVLKRSVKRPRIRDSDRMFWILMKRMLADQRDAVHFVKPGTVVRRHGKGFRYYRTRKSKPGRPPISMEVTTATVRWESCAYSESPRRLHVRRGLASVLATRVGPAT